MSSSGNLPGQTDKVEHSFNDNKAPSESFVKKSYEEQKEQTGQKGQKGQKEQKVQKVGKKSGGGFMSKLKAKFKKLSQKTQMNKGASGNVDPRTSGGNVRA